MMHYPFIIVADTCLLLRIVMKHQGVPSQNKTNNNFIYLMIYTKTEKDIF